MLFNLNLKTVGLVGAVAVGAGYFISIPAGVGALLAGLGGAYFLKVLFTPSIALDASKEIPFELINVEEISHDTKIFRFALQSPKHVLGLPVGEHMNLVAEIDGKKVRRAYTPISSDDEIGYFDLLIKIYRAGVHPKFPNGGKMTQYVDAMKIGETINVRGPVGHITYNGNGKFVLADKAGKKAPRTKKVKQIGMIAGGSGITPMYQIMKEIAKRNDPTEVFLLFGNQTEEDILLQEELEELSKLPNIHIWYTLDRPSKGWTYSSGFVDETMLRDHMPAPGDSQILICGPVPMVNYACKPNLEKLGFNLADDVSVF
eukprot:m.118908 g.118908  ORF g.118908 m.118908 type:complete len:316 (+) comp9347_c1_seq1:161-1108(+)